MTETAVRELVQGDLVRIDGAAALVERVHLSTTGAARVRYLAAGRYLDHVTTADATLPLVEPSAHRTPRPLKPRRRSPWPESRVAAAAATRRQRRLDYEAERDRKARARWSARTGWKVLEVSPSCLGPLAILDQSVLAERAGTRAVVAQLASFTSTDAAELGDLTWHLDGHRGWWPERPLVLTIEVPR